LSVAVKVVIEIVREDAVGGTEKAVTCGAAASVRVTVVDADTDGETLPAASLAQAKRVFTPELVKV
jgi:hypothetical protein